MKTSELLKEAKKNLWDGNGQLINAWAPVCSAVKHTGSRLENRGHKVKNKHAQVCRRIADSLAPHHYVTQWLHYHAGVPAEHLANHKDVQAYRHRWLDSLIAEYETQGD